MGLRIEWNEDPPLQPPHGLREEAQARALLSDTAERERNPLRWLAAQNVVLRNLHWRRDMWARLERLSRPGVKEW